MSLFEFSGKIRCKNCGHRFFKGSKEPLTKCPICGDPKSDDTATSNDIQRAKERDDELTV